MSGDIDATSCWLKAQVSALCRGVANEHTWGGPVFKFVTVVRSQPWKTETTIDFELCVVRLASKDLVVRRVHVNDGCWETVYEVCSGGEGVSPVGFGHR